MSTQLRANTDPTRTTTLRERFKRRMRVRWRDLRRETEEELEDDRGLVHEIRTSRRVGTHEFRRWFSERVDEIVLEPTDAVYVRDGRHWTAPYIRDAYMAGLRRADSQLEGNVPDSVLHSATSRHTDEHEAALESEYVAIYHDLQDASWATITDASRAFRETWESRATPETEEMVEAVSDRIDSVGKARTQAAVANRVVEAFNGALLISYVIADVDGVGMIPETQGPDGDPESTDPEQFEAGQRINAHAGPHGTQCTCSCGHEHHAPGRQRSNIMMPGEEDPWRAAEDIGIAMAGVLDEESLAQPLVDLAEDGPREDQFQWVTAGDERVCDRCARISGSVYTTEMLTEGEAPLPPQHPNCRCSLVPLTF